MSSLFSRMFKKKTPNNNNRSDRNTNNGISKTLNNKLENDIKKENVRTINVSKQGTYKRLLDQYKKTSMFQVVLNIILVCEGIRPAFLFESGNYSSANNKQRIFTIVDTLNTIPGTQLVYSTDSNPFPRTFVYMKDSFVDRSIQENTSRIMNDTYIARYLGFHCVGHDYEDFRKRRIFVTFVEKITGESFIAEVCEVTKINVGSLTNTMNEKNDAINSVLRPLGYRSVCNITTDIGTVERYEYLKRGDISYIKKNISEYVDDFANNYISGSDGELEESMTYSHLTHLKPENIQKLAQLYYMSCVQLKLDPLYEGAHTHNAIHNVSLRLLRDDAEFWKGTLNVSNIGRL